MTKLFVVVGAQKARTSSLVASLSATPQVYLHPREVALFEAPYAPMVPRDDFVHYLTSRTERAVGFKRADLLGRAEAPANLRESLGEDVLIVVSLRPPVDRALSALFWYVRQGLLPPLGVNELLDQLLTRGWIEGFPRSGEILTYGYYVDHLDRYAHVFGRDQIFVTLDRAWDRGALARLTARLGLDGAPQAIGHHEKRGQRSVRRAAFTSVVPRSHGSCPDWRAGFADGSLSAALERRARDLVDKALLSRLIAPDQISPSLMDSLRDHYAERTEKLNRTWDLSLDNGGEGSG